MSDDRSRMLKNVLAYISGPMTAKDGFTIEENTAAGVGVYLDLLKRGIPAFSPHLSGAFPSAWSALSHGDWLAYDFAVLDRCSHVLMMPRWESSAGALREFDYAKGIGLPIYFSADELARAVGARLTDSEPGTASGSADQAFAGKDL